MGLTRVGSTPGTRHNHGVNNGRHSLDAGVGGGNSKRRRTRIAGARRQGRVGRRDDEPDAEDGEHVKHHDSPEDSPGRAGDVAPGVLRFRPSNRDVLDVGEGVRRADQDAPEADEPAPGAGDAGVLDKRPRAPPEAKANGLAVRSCAGRDADALRRQKNVSSQPHMNGKTSTGSPHTNHDVDADDEGDFQHGKDKLELAVDANEQQVAHDQEAAEEGNPHGVVDVRPVVDDDGARDHFRRQQDRVCIGAVPALGKGQGRIDKPLGVADDAARQRDEGAQLGDGHDDGAHERAYDAVRQEQAQRPSVGESPARREEESRADGAGEGYHLDVSLLQAALSARHLFKGPVDFDILAKDA